MGSLILLLKCKILSRYIDYYYNSPSLLTTAGTPNNFHTFYDRPHEYANSICYPVFNFYFIFIQAWFDCDNQDNNERESGRCKWKAAALYPGLTGCMTKMVIGRGCCDKYDITRDDMKEAKRRIKQDFAFIGNLFQLFHYHSFQGKSLNCLLSIGIEK